MDFWVYMLRCADDSFYVGHSDDLERRLAEHEHGFFPHGFTARRLPARLVFAQPMPTREEAIEREMQLKNWNRKKKQALAQSDWAAVRWWGFTAERRQMLIRLGVVGPSSTSSDRPDVERLVGPSSTSSDRPDVDRLAGPSSTGSDRPVAVCTPGQSPD